MDNKHFDRRGFLKAAGAAGIGSVIAGQVSGAEPNQPEVKKEEKAIEITIPKRKLGRAEQMVPVLSNGVMFNVAENKIILRANMKYNVTYWDTANSYAGGNSELGIGQFLKKDPEARKDIFLVTKASGARNAEQLENKLQESLRRMNTDYIDMYYGVHACDNPGNLTDEMAKWAESAKKRKLIKYTGFSTHSNMAKCLMAASKLDWIDGIMTSYNISLMQQSDMQEAVQACHEAGIGLIAMKVLQGVQKQMSEAEEKLLNYFTEKGYTPAQAKIKVVLEDERICSACVRMENLALLKENVAAVLDKTRLDADDIKALNNYAARTCSGYCAGCSQICAEAVPEMPYTAEVMRYLMYYNSYGDTAQARELFAELPAQARRQIANADYRLAEARCPQHMPIAQLMAEAAHKLA
ncbi:MAG: aldo/keto reductase [Sedimentisphaerales bacterium]|nr:aldo/keto reductase [Sedimentisphaerales bacterium]